MAQEICKSMLEEFVRIHPFTDGNGRTSRLLLNFILMINKFKPIIIKNEERPKYYESVDEYATENYLNDFYKLIIEKEYQTLEEYKNEIEKSKKINNNKR